MQRPYRFQQNAALYGESGPGAGVDNLLLESGDDLLLESGDAILLE